MMRPRTAPTMRPRMAPTVRPVAWFAVPGAVAFAADRMWVRARRGRLPVIPAARPGSGPVADRWAFVVAGGVRLDGAARRAAASYAEREGLAVVDLVPGDLPAGRLRDLLRRVDPATYRRARLAAGQGAYQGLLADRAVLARAGVSEREDAGALGLVEVTARLKRYAPAATGIACLPGMGAAPPGERRARRDLSRAGWAAAVPLVGGPADPDLLAAGRRGYTRDLAGGLEGFFEPRRRDCPWCGGQSLTRRLTSGDLSQTKPGVFRLDACRACGHVFQNPRLTPAGLEFYYRDFYDGLGEARMRAVFGFGDGPYLSRLAALPAAAVRGRWLDVGAGHGHFCNVARGRHPDITFEGLDQGEAIEEAARAGWVDRAHRGSFPALAPSFAGRYDVVSMFHYLEHTRDPFAELDAARAALRPGGHLVVELPNIESLSSRLLGRWWAGWLVPQHQHLPPADNLLAALTARGLTPVSVQFGEAHAGGGPGIAAFLMLQRLAPNPAWPWRPDTHPRLRRGAHLLAMAMLVPVGVVAALADAVLRPVCVTGRRSDAYRVVARRDGGSAGAPAG
jgi:SAM-dependent methyltransferase